MGSPPHLAPWRCWEWTHSCYNITSFLNAYMLHFREVGFLYNSMHLILSNSKLLFQVLRSLWASRLPVKSKALEASINFQCFSKAVLCHSNNFLCYRRLCFSFLVSKPAPYWEGTAVINGEFKELKLTDYRGKYLVFFFYPLDL